MVTLHRWKEIVVDQVSPMIARRLVSGDRVMLAHVELEKGCVVPTHSHEHEQFAYVLKGAVRFWIGDDGSQMLTVTTGEVLHLPSDVPHKAEALEQSSVLDVFSPPRRDWLEKTDAYLRS